MSLATLPGPSVTLAWNVSTDPTVTGYKVYFGVSSGSYTNSLDAGTNTTATIFNLVAGATYYFAATTYNSSGMESAYSTEASLTLGTTSPLPPTLDPINSLVLSENAGQQTVNLTGISAGSTNLSQPLVVTAFSSDPTIVPNPTVNYVSPNSAGSLSFTPVPNAFGSVTMTVMVDNGNTVSNTVIRTFLVTVNPINNPPTLDPVANLTLNENAGLQLVNLTGISSGATNEFQPLTITAVSSNPNLIPNPTVTYTSPNPTGLLSFAPITNTFGGATITVSISDGQSTNSTTAQSFVVTVNQVVAPPPPITNVVVYPNTGFRFVLSPPFNNNDQVSYALGTGAPSGVKIVTHKGISALAWTPTSTQASSTNNITVVITDKTTPALSTNEVVRVIVLDYISVAGGSVSVQAGSSTSVPIYLASSDNVTNLTFKIGWPANRFANPSLSVAWPGVSSSSLAVQSSNLLISIAAPRQPLQGSNLLAQLNFDTLTSQHSAFVSLPVVISSAIKPTSLTYSNYVAAAGRAVVVADMPLLEGFGGTNRSLYLYGKVGATYQLQYCTNLGPSGTWYAQSTYSQTNVAQPLNLSSSSPSIVYRLLQK